VSPKEEEAQAEAQAERKMTVAVKKCLQIPKKILKNFQTNLPMKAKIYR
jgi:hypothetical protein